MAYDWLNSLLPLLSPNTEDDSSLVAPWREENAENKNGNQRYDGHHAPDEPPRNHPGAIAFDGAQRLLRHLPRGDFEYLGRRQGFPRIGSIGHGGKLRVHRTRT